MSGKTTAKKINATKDYRMFTRSDENRPLDIKKHHKLVDSMKLYGFLPSFPIVCHRNGTGKLHVDDGQHRLAIAESLGLTVWWTEEEKEFDIAIINGTAKTWQLQDYALKFSASGKKAYQEGIEFRDQHGLPIGTAFALLAGYTSFSRIADDFTAGTYRIKDRVWADAVAGIYGPITQMQPALKNARFIEACMGVCRVTEFDSKRLLRNAERTRDKLIPYSTRDSYLDMLEDIYNHHCMKLFGLKSAALMAMRERNAAKKWEKQDLTTGKK